MLAAGVGLAASVIITFAAAQREADMSGATRAKAAPDRNHIAASLLLNLLVCGGTPVDVAMRTIRKSAGLAAPVTSSIHITNWTERYAKLATPEQRMWLLDTAVRLVADRTTPVPLRQYSALLDLSFALGFQTDALAKLRDTYGFDYVDHAKAARPRSADRAGVSTPLYSRDQRETSELLLILGTIGIYLGLKWTRSKEIVIVKEVPVPTGGPFVLNALKLKELGITQREHEILGLIAQGLSNREIGEKLFVSENTVKTHSSRLFEKMQVNRRVQAVQKAKDLGLIP